MSLLHQLLIAFRNKVQGGEEKEQQPSHTDGDEEEGSEEIKRRESGGEAAGRMQQPPSSPPRPLSPVARYSLSSHETSYQLDDTGAQGRNVQVGVSDEHEEQAAWQQLQREPPLLTSIQPGCRSEYKQRRSAH